MQTNIKLTNDSLKIMMKFKKLPRFVNEAIKDELDSIGQDIRSQIMLNMKNTPRSSKRYGKRGHRPSTANNAPAIDSGKLVGSFEVKSSRRAVEVGTNVVYAKFLENGTSPHQIKAVRKKGLSEGKGGIYFGPLVNHPGIKPRPFLKGGYEGIKVDERMMNAVMRGMKK
jgi:phage gpG-like protein